MTQVDYDLKSAIREARAATLREVLGALRAELRAAQRPLSSAAVERVIVRLLDAGPALNGGQR